MVKEWMPEKPVEQPMVEQPTRFMQRVVTMLDERTRNLSIRDKLTLGFGVLAGLTFLVVGRGYVASMNANLHMSRTQTLRMPATLTSVDAQANLLRMSSHLRGYLATGESEFRDQYQQARQQFEAELTELETLFQKDRTLSGVQHLRELRQLYATWLPTPDRLFQLRDNSLKNQPALKILHQEGEVPIAVIYQEVGRMLEVQEQRSQSVADAILLKHLVDFKSSFALQVSALRGFVTTRDPSFRFEYAVKARESEAAWQELVRLRTQLTPAQQASLDKMQVSLERLKPLPTELFEIASSARYREDLYLFQTESLPLTDRMLTLLETIVKTEQQALTADLQTGRMSLKNALIQTFVLGILALVLAIGLAIVLRRQIADPIKRLTRVTAQILEGDLDARALVESKDEIGLLAQSFNQMTDSLQHSHAQLQDANRTLEHRVEERTQELQAKNEELGQTLRDLQTAQAQLIQTEKMSSLGQLVAGVAHEINNPVNFIHGNTLHANQYTQDLLGLVQLYQKHYPRPIPEIQEKADEIDLEFLRQDLPKLMASMKVGTERIRGIVQSLRVFSRLDEAEVKEVDLHEGLESTLMILHNRLKAKPDRPEIQVVKQYSTLPLIECYAGQLNQVFMNILTNAIDALEEWAETSDENSCPNRYLTITIRTEVWMDAWAIIRIADNGPGMPEEVRSRLFDPFFTTKAVGKGTGLGMSISHQIVTEKHGGSLRCVSEPGQGAEFILEIPFQKTALLKTPAI
ncbi:MAG: ATP-binding protein [Leptolyngbyaceae cyanobacterium bins.59]|nr:ATP-binding protein [Leptolyngbyaceae cyanobacterium bins.59]